MKFNSNYKKLSSKSTIAGFIFKVIEFQLFINFYFINNNK